LPRCTPQRFLWGSQAPVIHAFPGSFRGREEKYWILAFDAVSQFRLDLSLRFEMTQNQAVLRVISTEGRNLEPSGVHLLYFMEPFFDYDTASFARMTNPKAAHIEQRPLS
jgi:hypothetical protein